MSEDRHEDYGEMRAALDRIDKNAEAILTESGRLRQMGGKVWVVDDEPDVADAMIVMLTQEGIDAEPVLGTASAVAKMRGGELPSLMILDLGMPNGGGNAVLAEAPHAFPVIVLTGNEDALAPEHRRRVSEVVSKTVAPTALLATIERLLKSESR